MPADQNQTPYVTDLIREKNMRVTSFHMPGHKLVSPPSPELDQLWDEGLFVSDVVEIGGNVDYLHAPKGPLVEAQRLAAEAVGADRTFFLINGSTVGNQAMMMAVAGDGQKVIVPRAAHRSVHAGLVLSGAHPVYVAPEYHPKLGSPLGVSVSHVRAALAANPDAVAIHVTAPNYYGYLPDVAGLVALAHGHGIPLIVDEAHGAHLAFHPDLPKSAVQHGADLVTQSTHKTLSALTQSSMLHCNAGLVDEARLFQVLTMLQSSSPSIHLLASLDAARKRMALHGRALLTRTLELAARAREAIRQMPGLWCYGDDLVGDYGIHAYDPTKLVIRVSDLGITGFAAALKLRDEHRIGVEFSEISQIICSLSASDTDASVDQLLNGLRAIAEGGPYGQPGEHTIGMMPPARLPEIAINLRQAYFAPWKPVAFSAARGQICAESIIPYPPGIPMLLPGEVIEQEMLDYFRHLLAKGGGIVGAQDATLNTIRVIA